MTDTRVKPAKTYYRGDRSEGIAHVWLLEPPYDRAWPLPLRLDLMYRSPSGLEWGYQGSGPAQLALALLAHATGDDEYALAQYMLFKEAVISRLNRWHWIMSAACVREWSERHPMRTAGRRWRESG